MLCQRYLLSCCCIVYYYQLFFKFSRDDVIISFRRKIREPVVSKYDTKENLYLKFWIPSLVITVMVMYKRCRTIVKTEHENCKVFDVKVWVHQHSVLNPLIAIDKWKKNHWQEAKKKVPWEMLYSTKDGFVCKLYNVGNIMTNQNFGRGLSLNYGGCAVVLLPCWYAERWRWSRISLTNVMN